MTDYEAVVRDLREMLVRELEDYQHGGGMSLAEQVHGEIHAKADIARLDHLIAIHTKADAK